MTNVLPLHLHTNDSEADALPRALPLDLIVRDPDVIAELSTFPTGEARDDFALKALRIGVLALRQARGQIDTEVIRREGDRLIASLETHLKSHTQLMHDRTSATLREYFDPESGRFQERVNRLIQRDGELEQMLRRQLGAEDSELAKTLSSHFGQESELLQWLNPDEGRGLLCALRETLEQQLLTQREHVLKQFSLDNKDGALSRFILELTERQGTLTVQLQEQIDTVVKEFSLDEENSALSRLVANVDRAQRTITREFSLDEDASALSRLKRMLEQTNSAIEGHLSLDEENSALARLKREMLGLLTEHREQNTKFQEEIKVAISTMIARKQEAAKSTRHGLDFEAAAMDFLLGESQKAGDVFEATGSRVGRIKNCKKGDAVVELGTESVAPGAKVVIEAKEVAGYQLADARLEIDEARQNRDACTGLFIFSRLTAPSGLEPVCRLGSDVYVVWDQENAESDLYLKLGLSLARALAVRRHLHDASQSADVQAIETAVLGLEKACNGLEELQSSAEQVTKHGDKMLKRIDLIRKEVERQLGVLKEKTQALKQPG